MPLAAFMNPQHTTHTCTHVPPPHTHTILQERDIDRLERDPEGDVPLAAFSLERDRLRWLLKAYLRTRLEKVQQFAGALRCVVRHLVQPRVAHELAAAAQTLT